MPQNTYHAQIDDTQDRGWVLKRYIQRGAAVKVCDGCDFNASQAVAVAAALNQASCVGWKAALVKVSSFLEKKLEESCPKKTKQ